MAAAVEAGEPPEPELGEAQEPDRGAARRRLRVGTNIRVNLKERMGHLRLGGGGRGI